VLVGITGSIDNVNLAATFLAPRRIWGRRPPRNFVPMILSASSSPGIEILWLQGGRSQRRTLNCERGYSVLWHWSLFIQQCSLSTVATHYLLSTVVMNLVRPSRNKRLKIIWSHLTSPGGKIRWCQSRPRASAPTHHSEAESNSKPTKSGRGSSIVMTRRPICGPKPACQRPCAMVEDPDPPNRAEPHIVRLEI
jgi:hypothetical protein